MKDHPRRDDAPTYEPTRITELERTSGRPLEIVEFGSSGAGVLLLHELPGMTPEFIQLAHELSSRGFHVYAPLFFGARSAHYKGTLHTLHVCASRDFTCFSRDAVSPVATDLAPLVVRIRKETGYDKVGVIGMCLTANVALKLAEDPNVRVVVASQPAIPFEAPWLRHALGNSQATLDRIRANKTTVIIQRFKHDCLAPSERSKELTNRLQPFAKYVELHDSNHGEHSVLTASMDYKPGTETRAAFDEIVARLHELESR